MAERLSRSQQPVPGQTRARRRNERRRHISVLAFSGFMLLFHYQNCAPASKGAMMNASSNGLPVSVIDDPLANSEVSFLSKLVEVENQAESAVLEGQCPPEQEDAVFGWKMHEPETGEELAHGYAKCQNEQFQVEVAPIHDLECGRDYTVTAQLGYAKGDEAHVQRNCNL